MPTDSFTLVWLRQDLRLADNPALHAAARRGRVLPIYILDDESASAWAMGGASRAWLHHSLENLQRSLDGRLQFFHGNAREIITGLAQNKSVEAVYWNRCYEPWRITRDADIKRTLDARGITVESFGASLLWEPWTVSKGDGSPYRVFTPYYQKGCLGLPAPRHPLPPPGQLECVEQEIAGSLPLEALQLLPGHDWYRGVLAHWEVGEQAAAQKLEEFCEESLGQYRKGRDFPALDATSRLSPHLHFGEISPQQAWHRVEHAGASADSDGPAHFLRELGWRDFSYYLLYHFPELPQRNFNSRFDDFAWLEADQGALEAWRRGQTGYPIVDAGMRELWQTGYMHNRVRMIVASFLIKNMLTHWHHGEKWFWDCLVDADLASNSASWQWCAGSGADAAPYFRIFNPLLQSEKFDPDGEYLARYCPELSALPAKWRHRPWEAGKERLDSAGIKLGRDYPEPMLDLKVTRERALARFKQLR